MTTTTERSRGQVLVDGVKALVAKAGGPAELTPTFETLLVEAIDAAVDNNKLASIEHAQAVALMDALFTRVDFEQTGYEPNYAFLGALRVAYPDLPARDGLRLWHREQLGEYFDEIKAARKALAEIFTDLGRALADVDAPAPPSTADDDVPF